MKSQVATEFLTIVSISIIILIPIVYFSFFYSYETTTLAQSQKAVKNIAETADYIYSLGNGSQTKIQISIPQSVVGSSVSDYTINLKISNRAGVSDVIAIIKANVTGSIPNSTGVYSINLQNVDGVVVIS